MTTLNDIIAYRSKFIEQNYFEPKVVFVTRAELNEISTQIPFGAVGNLGSSPTAFGIPIRIDDQLAAAQKLYWKQIGVIR